MRRWAVVVWAAVMVAALSMTGLSGCVVLPDGVDGDLTNNWAPMPAATQFRPQPGTCHDELVQTGRADDYAPVGCSAEHLAETVAVAGISSQDQAFRECSRHATEYLGADWRTGWVVLQPVLPSKAAWAGGARWARCDVAETSPVDGALVRRSGTVRGALAKPGKLRMACANPTIKDDAVTEMHPVDCARNHTAEFAGLFVTTRPDVRRLTGDDLADGCETAIAKFAALPDDGDLSARVGWLGFPPDESAWKMGDRAVRCFLWLNGEKMKGSYRNAGPDKLKIHYVRR